MASCDSLLYHSLECGPDSAAELRAFFHFNVRFKGYRFARLEDEALGRRDFDTALHLNSCLSQKRCLVLSSDFLGVQFNLYILRLWPHSQEATLSGVKDRTVHAYEYVVISKVFGFLRTSGCCCRWRLVFFFVNA